MRMRLRKALQQSQQSSPTTSSNENDNGGFDKENNDNDDKTSSSSLSRMIRPRRNGQLVLVVVVTLFVACCSCLLLVSTWDYYSNSNNLNSNTTMAREEKTANITTFTRGGVSKQQQHQQQQQQQHQQSSSSTRPSTFNADAKNCTIWIAPSSIPGHAGYGIYTTRNLQAGESLLGYPDGLDVALDWRQQALHPSNKHTANTWRAYWWLRNHADHAAYDGQPGNVIDYLMGLGNYPNHFCFGASLHYRYGPHQDDVLDRFQHAMAGAVTYHTGKELFVYANVTAGQEVFLNYGICGRKSIATGHPVWGASIITYQDMDAAVDALHDYQTTGNTRQLEYDATDGHLIVHDPSSFTKHTLALLPKTRQEWQALQAQAAQMPAATTDEQDEHWEQVLAQNTLLPRTSQWIQQHGVCMMTLKPGTSTLAGAGRGAFAQFDLAPGDVISLVPLLHVRLSRDKEDLHNAFPHNALLVNYCFRHAQSSLLLCPLANAGLINHCSSSSTTSPNGNNNSCRPNAALRWATDATTTAWRQMTLDQIAQQDTKGLTMEIVASTNIAAGQEVFLDYGVAWEQAYQRHVATWKPPAAVPGFLTAAAANAVKDAIILPAFVSGDLRKTVTHPHLFTACQYTASQIDQRNVTMITDNDWQSLADEEILKLFGSNAIDLGDELTPYEQHPTKSHWPCTVIWPNENHGEEKQQQSSSLSSYTVRLHQSPLFPATTWHQHNHPRFLINYPRHGIHYFVHPQKSDAHLPGVFRQSIGLPDEMVPEHWKDWQ